MSAQLFEATALVYSSRCNWIPPKRKVEIAKLRKDKLELVDEEITLLVPEDLKKIELKYLIENSDVFKNDFESVTESPLCH